MDSMSPRGYYEDVLGFTNQTAVLLSGMGAKELLPEFKQRNISTEVLAELTIDDLILLGNLFMIGGCGADSKLADHMHKELTAISKRRAGSISTPEQRLDQLSDALVNNNKQLSLIHAFLTYARLRIKKESIDSFVERNNNLRSSKALEYAVEATISEIQDARLAVEELKLFLEDGSPSNSPIFHLAALSGIGIITFVILRKFL